MKKFIYIAIGLFATILITSCDDKREYDVPEFVAPSHETKCDIISIAKLKDESKNFPLPVIVEGYNNQAGNFEVRSIDNTNFAIKGRVSANDESGNIYKQFFIEDETGAIIIGSNLTGVFSQFRIGQEIIIELDGLNIGKYGGSFQIGSRIPYISYNPDKTVKNASIGRLTPREFHSHIFRVGAPQPEKIVPKELTSMPTIDESNRSKIVTFKNVSFEGAGTIIFASKGSGYGSVNLLIGNQKVLVRTSEYANFAADKVPTGKGNVTCVLGKYNNTVQLTIRGREDLDF